MNQLLRQLQTDDFTLLVSLPANDIELARAAFHGGAQGLKVHCNVAHFASGTRFGSWNEERAVITQICELAREHHASVGIVPGASHEAQLNFASEDDFADMAQVGVDYFDAYPADAPAWTLQQPHLDVMLAAYNGGSLNEIRVLETLGMRLCEASIMAHTEYGQPLNALDLACYHALCDSIQAPVIVPSQKKLMPHDVPLLQQTGARGVLLGAIVVGRDAVSIEAATRAFCAAMPQPCAQKMQAAQTHFSIED